MLRWLTAGESHGPELIAIVEGLPAGIPVSLSEIRPDLARRKLGYGRGARMKFEQDELTLSGGVRHGLTLGGPVALRIGNTEWPKWAEVMSPEPVDPSHPDPRPRCAPDPAPPRPRRPRRHAEVRLRRGSPRARAGQRPRNRRPRRPRRRRPRLPRRARHQPGQPHPVDRPGPGARGCAAAAPDDVDTLDADPLRCFDAADIRPDGRRGRRRPQGRRHPRRRRRGARLRPSARPRLATCTGTAASTPSSRRR